MVYKEFTGEVEKPLKLLLKLLLTVTLFTTRAR
jgi:hypothetical protein